MLSFSQDYPRMRWVVLIVLLTFSGSLFAQDSPNVLLIFTDDQGTLDMNCYGSEDLQTPHMDALAASGVRFTQFYAAAPVCSPSRAGLLTGVALSTTTVDRTARQRTDSASAQAGLNRAAGDRTRLPWRNDARQRLPDRARGQRPPSHLGPHSRKAYPLRATRGFASPFCLSQLGGLISINYSHFFYVERYPGPPRPVA